MIHIELEKFATANRAAAVLENPEKVSFSLIGDSSHGINVLLKEAQWPHNQRH